MNVEARFAVHRFQYNVLFNFRGFTNSCFRDNDFS